MKKFQLKQTNEELQADLDKIEQLFDLVYPVGSIYMSANNVSPATLFSGTWEAIEGKFLLSADSTYEAGSTGGTTVHTPSGTITIDGHILTTNELPSHTHSFSATATTEESGSLSLSGSAAAAGGHNHTFSNGSAASAGAHGHTFTGTAVYTDYQLGTHTHTFTTSNNTHSHTYNNDQYNGVNIQSVSTSVSKGSEGTSNTYAPIPHGSGNGLSYVKLDGGTQYYSSKSSTSLYQETVLYADLMGSTAQDTHNHTGTTDASGSLSHRHTVTAAGAISNTDGAHTHTVTGTISTVNDHTHIVSVSGGNHTHSISISGNTDAAGSSAAHSHTGSFIGTAQDTMPPYLAVYMWKRVA